jgi:hypothetical protein
VKTELPKAAKFNYQNKILKSGRFFEKILKREVFFQVGKNFYQTEKKMNRRRLHNQVTQALGLAVC